MDKTHLQALDIKYLKTQLNNARITAQQYLVVADKIVIELERLGVIVPTEDDPLAQRGGSC